jgi:hypothetical protein
MKLSPRQQRNGTLRVMRQKVYDPALNEQIQLSLKRFLNSVIGQCVSSAENLRKTEINRTDVIEALQKEGYYDLLKTFEKIN